MEALRSQLGWATSQISEPSPSAESPLLSRLSNSLAGYSNLLPTSNPRQPVPGAFPADPEDEVFIFGCE